MPFFTSCGSNLDFAGKNLIKLADHHVINESGCGDALFLVDELKMTAFQPRTFWFPKERSICNDEVLSVVIKLDTMASLEYIHVYSDQSGKLLLSYFEKEFVPQEVSLSSGWNTLTLKKTTQYIKLQIFEGNKLGELVLEGKYLFTPVVKSTQRPFPTFNQLMGTNAFVDDAFGAMDVVENVREYHETDWHQKDSAHFNFSPSHPGFDFDLFYQNFNKQGRVVVPVIQHSLYWLTNDKNAEVKPLNKKWSAVNPDSYREHSRFMYEFVNNYTSKGVAINYIENWNEPDKWWHGNDAYITPYEYAAMSSQDWDGHKDSSKLSIRKAATHTKMVMAGLTELKSDYVNAMRYWCDQHRAGDIPWKVVNAHVYANDASHKKALSPEKFALDQKVGAFVKNARISMPQTEVWLTEFGYDRDVESPQGVPVINGYTADQVQAIWLLRSFLLLSGTGLDKAYQYMIRDTKGKGLYMSSGLYKLGKEKIEYAEAWYYLKSLRNLLGQYHFVKRIATTQQDVYVYEFENAEKKKAYAVWAGVDARKTYAGQTLTLNVKGNTTLHHCEFGKSLSVSSKPLKYSNKFTLDVTEKPILLLEQLPVTMNYVKIPIADLIIEAPSKPLFDEQEQHDPLYYLNSKPTSLHEAKFTTVKFTKELQVEYLNLFDDQGQSEVVIEVMESGDWVQVFKGKLFLYQKWKNIYVGKLCTGLRITHQGNTSKIGEIVMYTKQ